MRHLSRLLLGILFISLSLLLLAGCSPEAKDEIPSEEAMLAQEIAQLQEELQALQDTYDTLSANYSTAKNEIDSVKAKFEELTTDYTELNTIYNQLNTTYNNLNTQFNELTVKYDNVMQGNVIIDVKDVEQALFKLINQERQNKGLDEVEWSDPLYSWAKSHNDQMAATARLGYSEYPSWQDVFRATDYPSAERMAAATLTMWKEKTVYYETNFLNVQANYGVVAVAKSGDIYYITYFASSMKS